MKLLRLLFLIFSFTTTYANTHNLDGARWIGAPGDMQSLYADYLPIFKINCTAHVPLGENASIIYGEGDPRLTNRNFNIYDIEHAADSIALKVKIYGDGHIDIFRYGYHPKDNPASPIATFPFKTSKEATYNLTIASNHGITDFYIDKEKIGQANLNPVGRGSDYLAFPVLAGMKVELPSGNRSWIENINISNYRQPSNILFSCSRRYNASEKIKLPVRSMPMLHAELNIAADKEVKNVSVLSTARGIYDISINGKRITDDYFNPGSTQYNKTHLYDTFNITNLLHSGNNTIDVQLAEGWWCGGSTYIGENWNFFGDRPSFIAKFIVEYTDGNIATFVTEPNTWLCSTDGPVVEGSFFQGEIFDSRKKPSWHPAAEISTDTTANPNIGAWNNLNLRPSFGTRVCAVDTIEAISMSEPRPGVYVYDMGQNMAGVPLLTFYNLPEGCTVTARYAEVLYPDMPQYASNAGMIMTENLRTAMCKDMFISSGRPQETFSPRYTLHGYRFIELTGLESPVPLKSVKAIPLSSITGFKADYHCSDSLVNRLWDNIRWSSLSNFISIPTDCPQRNERLGWMGDISVFSTTATKIADVSALLRQYLQSVRDCTAENGRFPDVAPTGCGFGGLLWGSAGITVPWECFRQYGDTALIKEHYPAMKKYIDYLFAETIDPATGLIVQNRAWGDLADWLSPEYNKTDKSLLWECYLIYDLNLMKQFAEILRLPEDAANYDRLAKERIRFFEDTFVDKSTGKTVHSEFVPSHKGQIIDTQVSYALPIAMGIYNSPEFTKNFVNTITRENNADDGTVCPPYSLMTGFIGTAWIEEALSKINRPDIAYRLLTSTHYPSWLYPVTQGATSVWERLNSYTHKDGFGKNNSMNSFNHYSFGAVGNWLITRSLGINADHSGNIIIAPEPDTSGSLTYASGHVDTSAGRIESAWRIEGGKTIYDITVPSKATIKLPDTAPRQVSAGHYTFEK